MQLLPDGDPICEGQAQHGLPTLRRAARQKAGAGGLGCHREQDGADGMGAYGTRRRV